MQDQLMTSVISSGVISVSVTGVVAFFANRRIEAFKAQLQERNIQYSKIFDRTAETIVQVYQKLTDFKTAVENYTLFSSGADEEHKEKLSDNLNKTATDFFEYFKKNKIYLPKHTAEKILNSSIEMLQIDTQYKIFRLFKRQREPNTPVDTVESYRAFKKMSDDVQLLLNQLEDEFRNLLGIKSNK